MSENTNAQQPQNPVLRFIIYIATFLAIYYAYTWWAEREARRLMKNAYEDAAEYQREAEKEAQEQLDNSGY